tara:strand:- start:4769 stop:5386 length:618 start_codon:yes stop_codon:yes gene_type:complete
MDDNKSPGYVWFDAEFTSIDLETAQVLQIAAIATDINLNPVNVEDNEINIIIKINKNDQVSSWVKDNLSILLNKCFSDEAVDVDDADLIIKEWMINIFGHPNDDIYKRPILAGNSVHNDWFMIRKFFPNFKKCLHYRLLDVSTLKILWKDWNISGKEFNKESIDEINKYYTGEYISKLDPHDALFDIKASISEMSFYKKNLQMKS